MSSVFSPFFLFVFFFGSFGETCRAAAAAFCSHLAAQQQPRHRAASQQQQRCVMAPAGTTWPLLSTLLSDRSAAGLRWSCERAPARGAPGGAREGEWGGVRGAAERIAWWIPTVKSDSLLKPSILVLCDTAKESVTRTGDPKGESRILYNVCAFCEIQLLWTKITVNRANITKIVTALKWHSLYWQPTIWLSWFKVHNCLDFKDNCDINHSFSDLISSSSMSMSL